MTFKDVCDELGIGEYSERIFSSNSHGELFHTYQYMQILEMARKNEHFAIWFPAFFKEMVKWAEETWKRPESVFQHTMEIMLDYVKES